MDAKSTYALRSADPGLSNMLTNLCFRIACMNFILIKKTKAKQRIEKLVYKLEAGSSEDWA